MLHSIDVVIPVHNGQELLHNCLKAVTGDANIIVVDDASDNANVTRIAAEKFGASFFKTKGNYGFGATCNYGASKGKAPLILFLNSDVWLEPNAITEMAKEFESPDVGAVGALLTFMQGTPHGPNGSVQHAGMAFDLTGKPFHIFIGWNPDNPRVNQRRELRCVTGACMMTRRDLWNSIGGFASVYGRGTYEDTEYCAMVLEKQQKVVFQPKARGQHWVGNSAYPVVNGQLQTDGGFPLLKNFELFRSRVPVVWDEYKIW